MNRQTAMILVLVCGFSFLAKLFFMDNTIQADGLTYYRMAQAWAITGSFQIENSPYLHNLGFPLLHGIIYDIFHLSYTAHLTLTVLYSVASLPFAYLFLRCFVKPQYAIIGTVLLAFNYRLLFNAGFGITESLFLLFVWASLYFSLKNNNMVLLAVIFSLLSVFVRFEGIAVFLFVLYQCAIKRKAIPFLVSFLALTPFYFTNGFGIKKIEESQYVSKHLGMIEVHVRHEIGFVNSELSNNVLPKILNSIVYFGWSLFPEFLLLVPFGLYAIYKKKISYSLLLWIMIFGGVGIYAYLDAYDTRYFFMSFLFVDLLCMIGLQNMIKSLRQV